MFWEILEMATVIMSFFKGAEKKKIMYFSGVVIILFDACLCRPAFCTYCFGELVFRFSGHFVFTICSVF